jgi:hypothetical protein
MTTSKIQTVHQCKPFNGQNGTTYYHNLTMENGDEINIGKKKEMNVGEELTYELTGGDDGQQRFKKAKSVQPENKSFSGGGKSFVDNSNAILYQTCLKAVSENYAARTGSTLIELKIEEIDRIATLALHLAKLSKENIKLLNG